MDDEKVRKLSEGLKRSWIDSGWHPVLCGASAIKCW